METKVNLAAVGLFVTLLTAAAIATVLYLSSGQFQRKISDTYVTYLAESVAGLNVNAPVKYRGVDVGSVRGIAIAPDNVEQVQLTLEIERGTPIREDTVALLKTQGLTGIAYVDLTGGRRDSPVLVATPGAGPPVIRSATSLMWQLESAVPELLAGLTRVADRLNATMGDENQRALRQTLEDLQSLTHALAARASTLDTGLQDAARAMNHVALATAELPQVLQRVTRALESFDQMTRQMAAAGTSAAGMLEATRGDLKQFTGETLPEVRALVSELRVLTASVQRLVDNVERDPGSLVRGRTRPAPGPGE